MSEKEPINLELPENFTREDLINAIDKHGVVEKLRETHKVSTTAAITSNVQFNKPTGTE